MRFVLPLVLLLASLGTAAQAAPTLTDVAVIPIHDGINTVEYFAADGRVATIVRAWRDNGNAHGHYLYLVTLPLKDDDGAENRTGVVAFDDGRNPLEDTAGASPFDGERVLQTVRFARAMLDGKPAVVMIRAGLGEAPSGVLADHAPVDIRVYRLESLGVDVGATPDVFRLVAAIRPPGAFCNADMALATALHLPLPADYAGGKGPGGCE
jgi:hypothetical protein